MTNNDLSSFHRAWDRFSGWLAAHSPGDYATLQPALGRERLDELEGQLGFALHPELRALLELHNGVREPAPGEEADSFGAGTFLPQDHRLNDVDWILMEHRLHVEIFAEEIEEAADEADDTDEGHEGADADGEYEELVTHAQYWVSFAHPNDGGTVFMDHRPGRGYGKIYEMGIGSGDTEGTLWASSLSELFDRLTDALEGGQPFSYYRPRIIEHPAGRHRLDWDIQR